MSTDCLYLGNLIAKANSVSITYFDKALKTRAYGDEKVNSYKLLGELERKNCPFIILLDRRCTLNDADAFKTITNAQCIRQTVLQAFFPPDTKLESKNIAFNTIFNESVVAWSDRPTSEQFLEFAKGAVKEKLLIKDSVFLAMSIKDGEIFNANKSIGRFYDEGKVWIFNEKYDYDPCLVDIVPETSESKIEKFSIKYESKEFVNFHTLAKFTREELATIINKYPRLFSDLVKRGSSYFDKEAHENVLCHPEEFALPEEKEALEAEIVEPDEFLELIQQPSNDENKEATLGLELCHSCENYWPEEQIELYPLNGKEVQLCGPCSTAFEDRD